MRPYIQLVVCLLIIISVPSHALARRLPAMGRKGSAEHVPAPELKAPTGEEVVLTSKKALEFVWSHHLGRTYDIRHYDFRLYKGYKMVQSALVFEKKVAPNLYKIELNSDLFEDGQVYTWSLRQLYLGGERSRRSYHSFKIIRK